MNTRTLDVALRIAADLDGAAKEVDALSGSLDGVKGAGQSAAQGLNAAAAASGKSSAANQANAAAAKAASTAQVALGAATQKTAAIQQRAAMTAGELRNAQRQLPMQITDIVTGLASGQPVFMVAIQQGGQLRDAWGGIPPAARALAGAISPVAIAVTAGAAAFAAIGVAAYQGYQQIREYELATISTGYSAGVTAGQLADMADEVGAATGKFGDADDAMVQLAASGKLTGETLQAAAGAAVNLATLTGESIESTTEKIIKLADAPSATLAKLNEQYHFLTAAVYDHVRSLEDQGRAEDATRVAVEEFARVHEQRVQEAEERAGLLERAWRGLGSTIAGIWNDLQDVGRTDAEYRLQAAQRALGDAQSRASARGLPFDPARYQQAIDAAQKLVEAEQRGALIRAGIQASEDFEIKASEAARKQAGKDREAAEKSWDQRAIGDLDKRAKLEEKIKEIRREGALLKKSDQEIEAQIANARARYNESLPKGRRTGDKSEAQKAEEAAQRELANLQKQIELNATLADGEKRVSNEARARVEIQKGAFRLSSEATQQAVLAAAKQLDAQDAAREATEKKARADEDARRAYERLSVELRTPIEAAIAGVTADIETLNKALESGAINAAEYQRQLSRIGKLSEGRAPSLPGQFQQSGGPLGDGAELAAYAVRLDQWRADEIAKADAFYAAKEGGEAEHLARIDAIQREYGAKQAAYSQAQSQFMLGTASSMFGSLAEIARNSAGEQSKTYQALFALSQGFAVAQALIAVYQNAANAMKETPYPYNIPIIAGAIAQGLAIVSQIRAVQPTGYADGGYTGPGGKYQPAGIVHKGEGVLSQEDIRALGGPAAFYALRHAIHNGYADGGLVMPTERAEPLARLQAPSASPVNMRNAMRLYLYQDIDQLAAAVMSHPATEKKLIATVGDNGQAIQASWGNG